jgi:hypothetical protein
MRKWKWIQWLAERLLEATKFVSAGRYANTRMRGFAASQLCLKSVHFQPVSPSKSEEIIN